MLTPSQLEKMPKELENHFAELEMRIMEDIVRRIKLNGEITRAADWQIYRLVQLGESKKSIKKMLDDTLKKSGININQIYRKAIADGYAADAAIYKAAGHALIPFRDNEQLQSLIRSATEQTNGELKNITQSMGVMQKVNGKAEFTELTDYYRSTLDSAMFDISTGNFDYNTVLKRTVAGLTASGLRTIDYATGYSCKAYTAARRALMTGITQVVGKINEDNARQLGTDYFEVSWHSTARPSHQVWQGKVYSHDDLVEVCGLGTVDGLGGSNCRHSWSPFLPGISERTYTDEQLEEMNAQENEPKEYRGKQYTSYEALQRQRLMEANMRRQRQQIKLLQLGEADEDAIIAAQSRYRSQMEQYVRFSRQMGLPQEMQRVYGEKLTSGKVVDKNSKKPVANSTKSSKIVIHKSLGASAKNYPVKLLDGKGHTKLVENQTITGKTFAGKGTDVELKDRFRLESVYKIPADKWEKVSGKGYVIVNHKKTLAELHWYRAEGEDFEMKIKRFIDESKIQK